VKMAVGERGWGKEGKGVKKQKKIKNFKKY
jgi:hypothetical protein